tara:strand:+ start:2811 stop:3731 length:921 start_codon:yes stop_codon:yes gene_type:complete
MIRKKLYVYKGARPHVHDNMEMYINTVPLSKRGIKDHFELVKSPEQADYFYMGQIPNEKFGFIGPDHFRYFNDRKQKHICDVEGEGGVPIPPWLHDCIITTMGPLKIYSDLNKLFTRPTFSHLLLDIIKNRKETFEIPNKKSFGFRGFLNHKIRAMMLHAVHNSDFNKEVHINRKWAGPSLVGGKIQSEYIQTMNDNLISLCPRGSGIDSVRLIESCYYTRVPVLISDHDYLLVGENDQSLDFIYRITGNNLNPDLLREQLALIYETPISELKERAQAAREYFDTTIREYFDDPTAYFLKWLEDES